MSPLVPLIFLVTAILWPGTSISGAVPQPAPAKCAGGALLRASEFPPPPADDRGFDVLNYDLDFRLDPVSSRITGTVAINLTVLEQGLDIIYLDLVDELTCTMVSWLELDLPFTHENDALLVQLPGPVSIHTVISLQVSWEGRPPRHGEMLVGLLFRHHNNGTVDDPADDVPIIANVSEPWSAHSWWPCKDHPADKALVTTAVTVPDTLRVVCNGQLLGVDLVEPGWHRFRWSEDYPLPTYLVSVAASDYHYWTQECPTSGGPVDLEFHYFPPDREKAEHDFAPTCDMMEFMVDLTGPYPFAGEKYAQVEIKWTGAMEHTTATSISQILLTGDGRFETLILHELAHHWFGNSLTPGAWSDIWLNEGFARYCEALWVEHTRGPEAYRQFMTDIGLDRHPTFFAGEGVLIDPDPILPNILVYDKGAWLLHSLRMLMGDGDFFTFLKDYATNSRLAQDTVYLDDMIAVAESHAGADLTDFFTPWLETDAVPEIWFEQVKGSEGAQVTIHQLQEVVFPMAVPVRLDTNCGRVDRLALVERRDQTFFWETGCPVNAITVDPDSTVFMFREEAPPAPLAVKGPSPNPVPTGGSNFDLFLTKSAQIVANMYDVRGHKIHSVDLGLVPETGPREDESSVPVVWLFEPGLVSPRPAAGIYWLEFVGSGLRVVRKITLVH